MAHLRTSVFLYAALVAQVALRYGGAGAWTPSLLLLVGLAAARRGGGAIFWAAAAGLICDSLSGRPLGVTMLAATLVAAVCGAAPGGSGHAGAWRRVAGVFLPVLAVEASARVLAATVAASPDYPAELLAAGRSALATTATAAAFWPLARYVARLAPRRTASPSVGGLGGAVTPRRRAGA